MTKLTKKKLQYLISEERRDSKMYHNLNLHSIGRDETKHARELGKLLKRFTE